jgi:hypothetical protein
MVTPTSTAPVIDAGVIDDRGKLVGECRSPQRTKTLKGVQIILPSGASITCVIRSLSKGGAKIVVHSPVPSTFDLVFDSDQSRRRCHVVWFRENQIGVRFL